MLEFHPLTLADRGWCEEIARRENSRSADFGFGNIYMWDKRYKQLVTQYGDRMLVKLKYEDLPSLLFPLAPGLWNPQSGSFTLSRTCGVTAHQRHYG